MITVDMLYGVELRMLRPDEATTSTPLRPVFRFELWENGGKIADWDIFARMTPRGSREPAPLTVDQARSHLSLWLYNNVSSNAVDEKWPEVEEKLKDFLQIQAQAEES